MPPKTILIVEDDAVLAIDLRNTLAETGYRVLPPAATGEQAIEAARDGRPDLILMDIGLAGPLNGLEAATCIQAIADIPIIYLAGSSQDPMLRQARATVPYGYLVKPVQERELVATIEMALYHHSCDRLLREREQQLRNLTANVPGIVYRCELRAPWRMSYMSRGAVEVTGRDPEEFLSDRLSWADIVLEEDLPAVIAAVDDAIARCGPFSIEYRIVDSGGNIRWVYESGTCVVDCAGPVCLDGVVLDVTGRKRAEAEAAARTAMSQIFLRDGPLEATYQELADMLATTLGFPMAAIETYDAIRGEMVFEGAAGAMGLQRGLRVPVGQTLSGIVATTGGEICEIRADLRSEYGFELLRGLGIKCFLCVPLRIGAEIVGTVALADRCSRSDAADWMSNLRTVASTLGLEIRRKRAEAELRASEERYRLMVETTNEGVWVIDGNHATSFVNQAMAAMLGFTQEEMLGRLVEEFQFPDDAASHRQRMERRHAGEDEAYERRFRRRDGSELWTLVSAKALKDGQGRFLGSFAMYTDITARKRSELALREKEAAIASSLNGIALAGLDGNITYVNQACLDLWGYRDTSEMLGRPVSSFWYSPEQVDQVRDGLRESGVWSGEMIALRKDGARRVVQLSANLVTGPSGKPAGMIGNFTDITGRKAAEAELRSAHARLDALWNVSLLPDVNLESVAECALASTTTITESEYGFYGVVNDDESALTNTSFSHQEIGNCRVPEELRSFPISEGSWLAKAIRRREPLIVNDYAAGHPAGRGLPEAHMKLANLLLAPVLSNGRVLALVGVANRAGGYSEEHASQLTSFLASVQAIVQGKRAIKALEASEATYRTLVSGLPDIIARMDRDGRHLFVSDNVVETVGLTASQFIGKTHRELGLALKDCGYFEKVIREVFDSGEAFETEYEYEGRRGPVILSWRLLPERGADGAVRSVLSIIRDITAQRRMEREYQALFRAMQNGFTLSEVIYGPDGWPADYRYLAMNPAFERLAGLAAGECMGRLLSEVLPMLEPFWREQFDRVVMTGVPESLEGEAAGAGKHFHVTALRPAPGRLACVVTDLTERRQAEMQKARLEEQLRQSQKIESIGRLAGGVAHDFNNLLTVINGYSEMALGDLDPMDPLHATLREIKDAGERAAGLTRQLLAFSRKQVLHPVLLAVDDVFLEMQKMLVRVIGEDIELEMSLDARAGTVRADPGQLQQVLMNLAVNARDAMPEGGKLTVRTGIASAAPVSGGDSRGPWVLISVCDTGIGMDGTTRSRLFEPFFTTKETGKGTGLGLSMVHGIIAQSEGLIEVDSEPGRGTTFRIYLPVVTEQTAAEQRRDSPEALFGRESILVVEDQPEVRTFTASVLKTFGYRVLQAEGAGQALAICEQPGETIDLLLTDIVMPGVNGTELADKARKMRPGIKVLYMSGYTDDMKALEGVREQSMPFLEKPFRSDQLARKVREVLGSFQPPARILVVDEEGGVRSLLRLILSRAGYEVVEAANAREVREEARVGTLDLIIADMGFNGREMADTIREVRRGQRAVAVIAVSGSPDGQLSAAVEPIAPDCVLVKPLSPDVLVPRVRQVLAGRRVKPAPADPDGRQ